MSTIVFACGCHISNSMFGEREVMGVGHCQEHHHLFSQDKTLRQMANELRELIFPTVDLRSKDLV